MNFKKTVSLTLATAILTSSLSIFATDVGATSAKLKVENPVISVGADRFKDIAVLKFGFSLNLSTYSEYELRILNGLLRELNCDSGTEFDLTDLLIMLNAKGLTMDELKQAYEKRIWIKDTPKIIGTSKNVLTQKVIVEPSYITENPINTMCYGCNIFIWLYHKIFG